MHLNYLERQSSYHHRQRHHNHLIILIVTIAITITIIIITITLIVNIFITSISAVSLSMADPFSLQDSRDVAHGTWFLSYSNIFITSSIHIYQKS